VTTPELPAARRMRPQKRRQTQPHIQIRPAPRRTRTPLPATVPHHPPGHAAVRSSRFYTACAVQRTQPADRLPGILHNSTASHSVCFCLVSFYSCLLLYPPCLKAISSDTPTPWNRSSPPALAFTASHSLLPGRPHTAGGSTSRRDLFFAHSVWTTKMEVSGTS
jgi:hypothetical protein